MQIAGAFGRYCLNAFLSIFILALPGLSHAAGSYILMKDLPAWVPGKGNSFRQILFNEDGTGQSADIANGKVTRVTEFRHHRTGKDWFSLGELFNLKDNYETARSPGLVVEGRTDKTLFVVHDKGRRKFISAENDLLPPLLLELRRALSAAGEERKGGFISASLLPGAATADLAKIESLPQASASILEAFPELNRALNAPFHMVAMPPEKWQRLLSALKLSASAAFVKDGRGGIMRIEFFEQQVLSAQ
jgi:hypothetical protein